jgi:hypothetical protein
MVFLFFVVCAMTVTIAVCSAPYYLFFAKPSPSERSRYRLTVLLVIAGLASVMSLLFGVESELTATVPVGIRLAGPWAGFIAALLLYLWWWDYQTDPPAKLEDNKDILRQVADAISATEERLDWIEYERWKAQLNGFEEINGHEEEHCIRNFLATAYAPNQEVTVEKVKVATAFIYLTNSVIKLQRIQGAATSLPARIRFRSNSSYGTRGLRSVILIGTEIRDGHARGVNRALSHSDPEGQIVNGYAILSSTPIDSLIVTLYHEYPQKEDYLLVDVARFSGERRLDLHFAVASTYREINAPKMWQMRRALVSSENRIPLRFRILESPPVGGWSGTLAELKPWLKLLDEYPSRGDAVPLVVEILEETRASIQAALTSQSAQANAQPMTFSDAAKLLNKVSAYEFITMGSQNTALIPFTWKHE